eukprot:3257228-Prymnesium_polylepis.1
MSPRPSTKTRTAQTRCFASQKTRPPCKHGGPGFCSNDFPSLSGSHTPLCRIHSPSCRCSLPCSARAPRKRPAAIPGRRTRTTRRRPARLQLRARVNAVESMPASGRARAVRGSLAGPGCARQCSRTYAEGGAPMR